MFWGGVDDPVAVIGVAGALAAVVVSVVDLVDVSPASKPLMSGSTTGSCGPLPLGAAASPEPVVAFALFVSTSRTCASCGAVSGLSLLVPDVAAFRGAAVANQARAAELTMLLAVANRDNRRRPTRTICTLGERVIGRSKIGGFMIRHR
jgi:hypothetical protein